MLRFSENRRSTGLATTTNPRTSLSAHGLIEATASQAQGGTVTGRFMSPLRVFQAIAAYISAIGSTGTGSFVFASSPTLVTPALGTPASGTLTNCTGLPAAGMAAEAWTAFTPVITAGSGTFTSVSATGRYIQIGKIVFFSMAITITTNGSAASSVQATLPATIKTGPGGVIAGRADAVSGKMLQGILVSGTTTINVLNYDNTYPGATGEIIRLTGSYEAA